ncbi:MAG: aldose epimerase family protein [Pricia sp.]
MQDIKTITIKNRNGLTAKFSSWGARLMEMNVPDRNGVFEDVVLGFRSKEAYLKASEKYHGAVVGRYCGRIPYGTFKTGKTQIQLPLNDSGKHHLHGGKNGFHLREWNINQEYVSENTVGFSLFSEDMNEGYPGNLQVQVAYTLTDSNQLVFEATASTDKKTLVNITNHAFFNLNEDVTDLSGHHLKVDGDVLVQDNEFLVTGEIKLIERPSEVFLSDKVSSAYRIRHTTNHPSITLSEPKSGRFLKIYTNQKAIQLYNGFFMSGTDIGKNGNVYKRNSGLAIEPQYLVPEKLNVISPGEEYRHKTTYEFGTNMVVG